MLVHSHVLTHSRTHFDLLVIATGSRVARSRINHIEMRCFFFRETILRTEFYVRFTNLIIARPTGDCNVRFAIRSLTRPFLRFTSPVRMCGFFNIEEHKPPRGGKRKMRVLSLTLEQRGYYRSMFLLLLSFFSFLSHSSIYLVCPHSFRVRTHQTYTVSLAKRLLIHREIFPRVFCCASTTALTPHRAIFEISFVLPDCDEGKNYS